jgi:hypothetical protein
MKTAFTTYAERATTNGHPRLAKRLLLEQRACGYLVDECLRRGYKISVHDGEAWCLTRSANRHEIMCALASTDEDTLLIRGAEDMTLGRFWLIYGNDGYDVIADYTANDECDSIMAAIDPKLNKLESEA